MRGTVLALMAAMSLLIAPMAIGGSAPAADVSLAASRQAAQPPIADPQALVQAYYQQLSASVSSGNFAGTVAFFTSDATIDSDLAAGGAAGSAGILQFFQSLPSMKGFTVDPSNIQQDDPYMDVDWRWRAAPGSMRGYLDGHDTFTIQNGLITALAQRVDMEGAAEAFMPPALGRVPTAAPVATRSVAIEDFAFVPQVIRVPVGATVTWTNQDSDTHAVTTVDKAIDAGVVEQNVSVTLMFSTAGTFQYYCTIHPGMRGTVIAGSASVP
jgi:plastocyanin